MLKQATSDLLKALHDFYLEWEVEEKQKKNCWIAYSGGLDSHVLLWLAHQLRAFFPLKLNAIHINHHLSPHSDAWSKHAEMICKNLDIPYLEQSLHLPLQSGLSLEASARLERYALFANYLSEGDLLLTAHHQDDQAETLLIQLLRGAGPKGLSAMPCLKKFARGFHGRPLLNVSRDVLHQVAKEQQLQWVEDESNQEQKLTRNFIRHQIIPLLQTRWKTVSATLARTALHCAQTDYLLEEYSDVDVQAVKGSKENTLSISKLLTFSQERQRMILRRFIKQQHFKLPSTAKLDAIQTCLLTAREDRAPLITWSSVEVRRYRDELYALPCLPNSEVSLNLNWKLDEPLHLAGIGLLQAKLTSKGSLRSTIQQVNLRFRQGGEVINLAKRGRHQLKKLFQEYAIPPWERNRIPLLFVGDELIAVVGYFVSKDYLAQPGEMGWEIV